MTRTSGLKVLLSLIVCVAAWVNLWMIYHGPVHAPNKPYALTLEKITREDIDSCRQDPNCMDITAFAEDKPCPDTEIWSSKEETCVVAVPCKADSDCGAYAMCIGIKNNKSYCLPI